MGKNSNSDDLTSRDLNAQAASRAKKKAKKVGAKKATAQNFEIQRVRVDDKFALNLVPTEAEAFHPQDRKFAVIALDKNGDVIRDEIGGLEYIQNFWPSFKAWAFGAKFGELLRLPGSAKNPEMENKGLREFSFQGGREDVIRLGRGWIRRIA